MTTAYSETAFYPLVAFLSSRSGIKHDVLWEALCRECCYDFNGNEAVKVVETTTSERQKNKETGKEEDVEKKTYRVLLEVHPADVGEVEVNIWNDNLSFLYKQCRAWGAAQAQIIKERRLRLEASQPTDSTNEEKKPERTRQAEPHKRRQPHIHGPVAVAR